VFEEIELLWLCSSPFFFVFCSSSLISALHWNASAIKRKNTKQAMPLFTSLTEDPPVQVSHVPRSQQQVRRGITGYLENTLAHGNSPTKAVGWGTILQGCQEGMQFPELLDQSAPTTTVDYGHAMCWAYGLSSRILFSFNPWAPGAKNYKDVACAQVNTIAPTISVIDAQHKLISPFQPIQIRFDPDSYRASLVGARPQYCSKASGIVDFGNTKVNVIDRGVEPTWPLPLDPYFEHPMVKAIERVLKPIGAGAMPLRSSLTPSHLCNVISWWRYCDVHDALILYDHNGTYQVDIEVDDNSPPPTHHANANATANANANANASTNANVNANASENNGRNTIPQGAEQQQPQQQQQEPQPQPQQSGNASPASNFSFAAHLRNLRSGVGLFVGIKIKNSTWGSALSWGGAGSFFAPLSLTCPDIWPHFLSNPEKPEFLPESRLDFGSCTYGFCVRDPKAYQVNGFYTICDMALVHARKRTLPRTGEIVEEAWFVTVDGSKIDPQLPGFPTFFVHVTVYATAKCQPILKQDQGELPESRRGEIYNGCNMIFKNGYVPRHALPELSFNVSFVKHRLHRINGALMQGYADDYAPEILERIRLSDERFAAMKATPPETPSRSSISTTTNAPGTPQQTPPASGGMEPQQFTTPPPSPNFLRFPGDTIITSRSETSGGATDAASTFRSNSPSNGLSMLGIDTPIFHPQTEFVEPLPVRPNENATVASLSGTPARPGTSSRKRCRVDDADNADDDDILLLGGRTH
jgi:hypothetical protein